MLSKERVSLEMRSEAEACRELGNFHFKNGQYRHAICAYLEGLKFFRDDLLLHCNLAQAYIKLKHYDHASCHASIAIGLDPTYWKGYARLSKALYETGRKGESYEVLMRGFVVCDQKEELQKCFYQIPATSDEEISAKAAKKLKKSLPEGAKKKLAEKKCQNSSDQKMDKDQNTVSVEDTAPTTTSSKAKSSQKKPVDFQDIKNDQFLELAEKSSNERFSGQRKEFEKLLEDGYAEAQKEAFTKALECYKKALKIREEVPLKYLGLQEKQCIVMTYILNLMRIKTNTYENLQQTISDLKRNDDVGEFRILPAFYYIRGLAYFKMNRFKAAIEELESCNELISMNFPFIQHCWPSTNAVIKETTKLGLQAAINDLMMQAKSCLHNVPAAICRFSQCHEVSTHILPSEQIFVTDPDFVGYVTITCEEKCHVQYHLHCWKAYRERLSEFEKIADKDMLGKPCPTTDCLNSAGNQSTILMVEIYGQDGAIKTQMKLDPIAGAAKQLSKNKKKKEDCKSEEKKDKEKVPKARKPTQRRKSQSDKKSVEQRSSLIPKKEPEEIFNGKMAQLINLRAVNFGCAYNSWNPNEAFYGRSDEKELCNSFVLKRVDNPLFVPDHNDQMTIIRMKFYKLLRKETFLSIEAIEEHWNDDDEFSSETRKSLNGSSIVDFLLQSTLFALLDDLMCTSENLPEAYKETEESLEQSVAFMIEGFAETVKENKNPEGPKRSQNDKFESSEKLNVHDDDDDVDDFEEDIEYNSESAEGSEGECSDCYESSENEDCLSKLEDGTEQVLDLDEEDNQNDCPVAANGKESTQTPKIPVKNVKRSDKHLDAESDETRGSSAHNNNVPKKILHEQSVQTETDNENSEKNVIENLKKKIELFNEKLTEKSEKIDALEAELSKSNSLNQKLETENVKLLDQKEKLNKKLTNQSTLFLKKEAALTKEIEHLKGDGKSCRDKLAILDNHVEKLLEKFKQTESVYEKNQARLEQSLRDLEKTNEQLKVNNRKIQMEGCELTLEMYEKRCIENIFELEVLSTSSRLSSHKKIKDSLAEWNKFKLKLNLARNTMETKGTNCDLNDLIDSVRNEEPQRIPIFSVLKGDLPNPSVQSDIPKNIQPEKPSRPVNGRVSTSTTEETPIVTVSVASVFSVVTPPQTDDDSASSNHSIDVLPNLHRSESTQNAAQGNSHEPTSSLPFPRSTSVDSQNDGVWEISGKHVHRNRPDLLPSTSIVKKRQFTVLKDKLQKQYPNKTESELEECIRTVRARNNNSLTGLRLNEIEYRVGKLLEERSKKPSTLGLDKFGKVGWCQNKPTENKWSGNIELEDCIICSEEIDQRNLTTLECYHYFHTECIRKWLKEKSICPLCTTFTKMPDEFPAL